jgi:hypothetical protein
VNSLDADRVERAIALAVHFHKGQRDKSGVPYLLHLFRIALQTQDPIAQQAALLHDLIEDTEATVDDMVSAGICPEAIEAIALLTHDLRESYADYVVRIKNNPWAKQVKLLDLHDNYRLDRVAYRADHVQEDAIRIQRYILSKQFLCDEISKEDYLKAMAELESLDRR